ncbi:MAG: succinate--CoA ligase subunit alpha [Candidatus Bathyarchaeia archaeon]
MSILLSKNTRVLIQGITGREGLARSKLMKDYGTNVVAGVTPGKGGREVWGIPVYDTVESALKERGGVDLSVTFVPAPFVKDAVYEALDAGVKIIVMPVERVPIHDILDILAYAKRCEARVVGPGSLGLVTPGEAIAGWIGGTLELAQSVFKPGPVGVMSRSGGQTTTLCWALTEAGLGESTAIHIGSEPVVGTSFAELLTLFEEDEQTELVVMFGEIGTQAEEEAAEVLKEGGFSKPLVAYVTGGSAKPGIRFSHASAIIEEGRGTAESKIKALREAGATVVERPDEVVVKVKELTQSFRG